jgi:hypothetical protein
VSSSTPSGAAGPTDAADKVACDQMQTVMAQMANAAATWVPGIHPFDRAVGTRIRVLTLDIANAERHSGTDQVRASLHQNTVAFTSLAVAMDGKSRKQVLGAVRRTQVAYAGFKHACGMA